MSENKVLVNMGEGLESENCCKQLFWQEVDTLIALLAGQYIM